MPPLLHLQCKYIRPTDLFSFILSNVVISLEAAKADPASLSQATIIDSLDPVEAARLNKCRNIGIAVRNIPIGSCLVFVLV